jgi:enolase
MAKIKQIKAYEIIDSHGFPTIEGVLVLDNGKQVKTSIPTGSSIGKYEAIELRDNNKERFEGMGVTQAVSYINDLIAPKLIGVSPLQQQQVDDWLIRADGTDNKSKLGANTLLTISQLFVTAAAADSGVPVYVYINKLFETINKKKIVIERIPAPIFNIINGAKHANNNLNFQEFQVIPSSSFPFSKAYQIGIEVYHELKRVLAYRNANISVGDEGGFTPNFSTNIDALEVLKEAMNRKGLKIGLDIYFGLDIAASSFYNNGKYEVKDRPHALKVEEYMEFILSIVENYRLLVLEDPLHEDDWASWKKLNEKISEELYLAGDDLITTNKSRLEKAIKEKACTTVVLKPNQIGTVTETLEVIHMARENNLNYIVSQRAGETNDTFIADLAVGIQADFVKFGAPSRGERVAKYNRLWQIEREGLQK